MGEGGDVDALMAKMDKLQTELDAIDGWEIDRQLGRAMDALRCPPGKIKHQAFNDAAVGIFTIKVFSDLCERL